MSKQILLDTNILVYSKDEASLYFSSVCQALEGLVESGVTLCVNKQILREYACVATRPAPKGLNADTDQVLTDIAEFETAYLLLPDPENIWTTWKHLVKMTGCTGLRLHDMYIAAAMVGHKITDILTLNTKDYDGIHDIQPVKPESWKEIIA